MKLIDHMVALFLIFSGTFVLFTIVVEPPSFSTNSVLVFSFLHILTNNCCVLFGDCHSDRYEVIYLTVVLIFISLLLSFESRQL